MPKSQRLHFPEPQPPHLCHGGSVQGLASHRGRASPTGTPAPVSSTCLGVNCRSLHCVVFEVDFTKGSVLQGRQMGSGWVWTRGRPSAFLRRLQHHLRFLQVIQRGEEIGPH